MVSPRQRLGVMLKFIVAIYIVALATLPFGHHDLVCHLKSSTHCGVCHVGTAGAAASQQPALGHADAADAGRAGDTFRSFAASSVVLPSSGRSPPANTPFLL